jgi:hypothetical protein
MSLLFYLLYFLNEDGHRDANSSVLQSQPESFGSEEIEKKFISDSKSKEV